MKVHEQEAMDELNSTYGGGRVDKWDKETQDFHPGDCFLYETKSQLMTYLEFCTMLHQVTRLTIFSQMYPSSFGA